MRKFFRSGAFKFEILDQDEVFLRFPDIPSAVSFLKLFKDAPDQITFLRDELVARDPQCRLLDADAVLERFAKLLVDGGIIILSSFRPQGGQSRQQADESARAQSAPVSTTAKTHWIEITLIDEEGEPVPGERYRIRFPDGSSEDSRLDGFGHAEHYGIGPGTCEVCFPDLDGEVWSRA